MIKEITDRNLWNTFAQNCAPNTFLHAWEWGQVQKATGEGVRYLGMYRSAETVPFGPSVAAPAGRHTLTSASLSSAVSGGSVPARPARDSQGKISPDPQPVGIALVITVNARRGRHYLIPHGPLVSIGADYEAVLAELIDHLREQAKQDHVVALRVAPLVETSAEAVELFQHHGFRPAPLHMHAERTWILDIQKPDEELLSGMRKTTRHAIAKAAKAGVTCEILTKPAEALERFWPLYEETRGRHGFVLWPKNSIKAQLELFSLANQIFAVVARYNNRDVAAALLPHFGDTAYYYHGASATLPSAVPATQLLQWAAIAEAKRRGATRYNFWGIAPNGSTNHPFTGITTFKTGFGGYAVDYLHAQDLPLSFGYWPLWAVDMYRKMRRRF